MTEAEHLIWRNLRLRQLGGFRFRRQVLIGGYIVDFACPEARLIIEIDGGQHDPASPHEVERSRFLEYQGYRVLRFWNLAASSPPPNPPPSRGREELEGARETGAG